MPIKSLARTQGRLPEVGVLRKGAPKPERGPGRDLDYFRFTSERPEIEARFRKAYGEQPTMLRGLYLMAPEPETVFDCWQEAWGAGSLKHRCDGEYVVRHQVNGRYVDPEYGKVSCPGGCARVGRLTLLLPDLGQMATVCLQTSSIWDILHIQEQLEALYGLAQMMPDHKSGSLLGIPICVRRDSKQVSVPGMVDKKTGAQMPRSRMAKSLISIEAESRWYAPALAALESAARPVVLELNPGPVGELASVEAQWVYAPVEDDEEEDPREIDGNGEIHEPASSTSGPGTEMQASGTETPSEPTLPLGEKATGPQRRQLVALSRALELPLPTGAEMDELSEAQAAQRIVALDAQIKSGVAA